jgi:hypothetical protein
MYSHYADSHKGICIEYSLDFKSIESDSLVSFGWVEYKEKSDIENIKDLYMLKNSDWEYEKEYRLVRFDNEEYVLAKIKGITFGFKCPEKHIKMIVSLLYEPGHNVKYSRMEQDGNKNDIRIKEIKGDELDKFRLKDDKDLFKIMLKEGLEHIYHYHRQFVSDKTKND